jgi:DNA (cytosine-5)-methyltransferase 1
MPNANTSSGVIRNGDEPAPTQGNTDRVGNQPRAWLSFGHVVKMTPRALARFQSFPDWYILPDKASLACTVIGNAVPPLLYQRVIEANQP